MGGFRKELKSCKKDTGLINVYRNTNDGKIYLGIPRTLLNQQLLYVPMVEDGVTRALFRGRYYPPRVLMFKEHFNKIEVFYVNHYYRSGSLEGESSRAIANVSDALLHKSEVLYEKKREKELIVDGDSLLLTEVLQKINFSNHSAVKPISLGKLNVDKSKVRAVSTNKENTVLKVDYIYDSTEPTPAHSDQLADSRHINIKFQHAFVQLPTKYVPRYDDPRVGYFVSPSELLSPSDGVSKRDFIQRWHIEKTDPEKEKSPVKKKIVWWIENSTPQVYRSIIREAVLKWNQSFEKIGFENVLEVKIQPDDALWDAGAIEYNVIPWVTSPQSRFSGYGPRIANPLTGQIIGADIVIDAKNFLQNVNNVLLNTKSQSFLEVSNNEDPDMLDLNILTDSERMNLNLKFTHDILESYDVDKEIIDKVFEQALMNLVIHEMGHALGLTHNFKASGMLSPDELEDHELVRKRGIVGSVMDYTPALITKNIKEQPYFFQINPGPYDDWAIEFGYNPDWKDINQQGGFVVDEKRERLLSQASRDELSFANDIDNVHYIGLGIDPHVNIFDLSNDSITYSTRNMDLILSSLNNHVEHCKKRGVSTEHFLDILSILWKRYNICILIISRFIGGVHMNRYVLTCNSDKPPLEPVDVKEQKRAMGALIHYAFRNNHLLLSEETYRFCLPPRRGFHPPMTEDPRVHRDIRGTHRIVLNYLFHYTVINRMIDSVEYGNQYEVKCMLGDLTEAIIKNDQGDVSQSFEHELQSFYVKKLIAVVNASKSPSNKYYATAHSMVLKELIEIKKFFEADLENDHGKLISMLINDSCKL